MILGHAPVYISGKEKKRKKKRKEKLRKQQKAPHIFLAQGQVYKFRG